MLGTAQHQPLQAKGVDFSEEDSHIWKAVVEGSMKVYMLHRVLYPQVHTNGFFLKKKRKTMEGGMVISDCPSQSRKGKSLHQM